MIERIGGGCLCGEVTFSVENEFSSFHLCHCLQCRKITGSAHASNLFTTPENIEWMSGQENIKRFELPDRDFTKVFCNQCGSGLPFITKSGKSLIVPAGSLNEEPNISPQDNIFWSERAAWYDAGLSSRHFAGFPN
jgi:hypothetical protein